MGPVRLGVGSQWLLDGRTFRVVRQLADGCFVAQDAFSGALDSLAQLADAVASVLFLLPGVLDESSFQRSRRLIQSDIKLLVECSASTIVELLGQQRLRRFRFSNCPLHPFQQLIEVLFLLGEFLLNLPAIICLT